MTIRAKLTMWFIFSAVLPAVVITVFAAGEAVRRFNVRAVEELGEAEERGENQLDRMKREIESKLLTIVNNDKFDTFVSSIEDNGGTIPDPFFAQKINEEFNLDLDFLSILDRNGIVISSMEWTAFAGKQDLQWNSISKLENGECLVGPTSNAEREILALRMVLWRGNVGIIGGWALNEKFLSQFRTSARAAVFLHNPLEGKVISDRVSLRRLANELNDILRRNDYRMPDKNQISLPSGEYLAASIPLVSNSSSGTLLFLYPRKELDEEITGLITTFLVAAAAGILLATFLGLVISRRVANPLRQLIYGFDLVSLGDFNIRMKSRRKDELGDILDSFNRMVEDLESLRSQLLRSERLAAWQDVARKIAHEIKNPLSPIQISIETLRKVYDRRLAEFDSIFEESTQTILEEVEKIRHIVQEFSDFARMPEPSFQPTNLLEVVRKAIRLFRAQLSQIELVEGYQDLPAIQADPEQLHRMMVNLINNSLDAVAGKGKITLELKFVPGLRGRKGWACFSIEDNGPGMDDEEMQNIFTPYYTTKSKGTGLGLVIVQRIVEQHKGRLNVTSNKGSGTKIEVYLPL